MTGTVCFFLLTNKCRKIPRPFLCQIFQLKNAFSFGRNEPVLNNFPQWLRCCIFLPANRSFALRLHCARWTKLAFCILLHFIAHLVSFFLILRPKRGEMRQKRRKNVRNMKCTYSQTLVDS